MYKFCKIKTELFTLPVLRRLKSIFVILILLTVITPAQSKRKLINDGVDFYDQKKYADAEVNFKK